MRSRTLGGLGVVLLAGCAASPVPSPLRHTVLPPLPGVGVAGAFAGAIGDSLLVGGGANFPDAPPWQGGRKVWTDDVLVLAAGAPAWRSIGRLPRACAYGVSVSTPIGVLCAGGSDATRHFADAFVLTLAGDRLERRPLPSLPEPVAHAATACSADAWYVLGGSRSPGAVVAERRGWWLDFTAQRPRWRELPPWPGPGRMLAGAAFCGGALFLVGGVALSADADGRPQRTYLRDAFRFDPRLGAWRQLPRLPRAAAAMPSPLPCDGRRLFVIGGDDGTLAGVDPAEHPGFRDSVLAFAVSREEWTVVGRWPRAITPIPVTAPTVPWGARTVVASGEIRPGVRSPAVVAVDLPSR